MRGRKRGIANVKEERCKDGIEKERYRKEEEKVRE